MRGRIIIAVVALAAFCASFGAPLEPLFARSMSCCPSGKAAACCKRRHSGAGWTVNEPSCGGSCACAFPSTGDATTIAALPSAHEFPATAAAPLATVSAGVSSSYQAFLFQRPPPARA